MTAPHGTIAAYQRHYYHGEQVCEPCKVAHREYVKGRPISASTIVRKKIWLRMRRAAVKELISRHYPEFLRIQSELKEADYAD